MYKIILGQKNEERAFDTAVTGVELAKSISKSLEKDAVAVRINGQLRDLTEIITNGAHAEIITRTSDEGLEILRHDAAHVLAEAVLELFPETKVTIGPAIDNGFYYDFYREKPFTLDDLPVIEQKMRDIVLRDEPITRSIMTRAEAINFYKSKGESFKVDIIEGIPGNEPLSFYTQGQFTDLCRGPHLPSTKKLGTAFKLTKLSGAYWRGDHRNPMLQRIYGTAWANDDQLKQYLYQIEEAEKRDHRRLGPELGLFHMQEEAAGSVFWHPKGWKLYRTIENFIRSHLEKNGYVEVKTPQILDRSFWEASGHWDKFADNMFTLESENRQFAIKPMNCPCHVQIFKQGIKSYRDLPIRMAEFGSCHRNEPSGSLHGLNRVRAMVQDDAHIFCTSEQIVEETKKFCALLKDVYAAFDMHNIKIKLSDRPEKRAGSDEVWDLAESSLKEAALAAGLSFSINKGEGAFYGPKLEFVLCDAMGRDWQCGTFQVDFVLPERLNASYIGEDGKKHRPVMLHRAVIGTFERFIGILIEHYAGKFPLWLAPVQLVIINVTQEAEEYCHKLLEKVTKLGIRADIDIRNEKINYKIREHSLQKVPVLWIAGKKEVEEELVSVRKLGSNNQEVVSPEASIKYILEASRSNGGSCSKSDI